MTTDIFNPSGSTTETDTVDERARRAVKAFRALQPTLTAYAKNMTGKPNVRVEMSPTDNGSTDGTRIFIRPPLALGDDLRHDRYVCNKRGPDGYQRCPSCAVREAVLRSIYHEIAHIAFGSFEIVTDHAKKQTVEFAVKELRGEWGKKIEARLKYRAPSNYMELASYINSFLPFLLNCMEDARVDAKMFKTRPGTRHMFEAETLKVFREGYEAKVNGEYKTLKWDEAPLNSQVMIGTYLKASGYDYDEFLHPDAVTALNDPQVTGIVEQVRDIRTASDVYRLALHVFARYRELGFFATPEDQDPEPEEKNEPSPDQESSPPSQQEEGGADQSGPPSPEGNPSPDSQNDAEGTEEGGSPPSREDEDSSGTSGTPQAEPSTEDGSSDEADAGAGEQKGDGELDGKDDSDQGDLDRGSGAGLDGDSSQEGDSKPSDSSEESDSHGSPQQGDGDSKDSNKSESGDGDGATGDDSLPDSDGDGTDSSGEGSQEEHDGAEQSDSPDGGSDGEASGEGGSEEVPEGSGGEEPVDQGADDGYGGTDIEGELKGKPEMGTPEDIAEVISIFGDHDEKPTSASVEEGEAVTKAIIQGIYFNKPSEHVHGVREHWVDKHAVENGIDYSAGWEEMEARKASRLGKSGNMEIPETILQPVLLEVRRTFTDNQRGDRQRNKKAGKVNATVLGRRAWNNDPRLFAKKTQPGRKSYAVIIGVDLSGSTKGRNLLLEKRAVIAQAEVLDRAGIPFAIIGHTGNYQRASRLDTSRELTLEVYHIKDLNQTWESARPALEQIAGYGVNLDGHALEYLRKMADQAKATDKIIMYYSDGKMPSTNHDEELEILQREIKTCRDLRHTLLGVGIRTDSPTAHGLPTVQVDTDSDLSKVVAHLGDRLSETQ